MGGSPRRCERTAFQSSSYRPRLVSFKNHKTLHKERQMFMHVVLMEFHEMADHSFFETVAQYVERVRHECPGLLMYSFIENSADRSDGLTHSVVSGFSDSRAHDDYQVSPVHVEMKNFMSTYIKRIVVLDGDALLLKDM